MAFRVIGSQIKNWSRKSDGSYHGKDYIGNRYIIELTGPKTRKIYFREKRSSFEKLIGTVRTGTRGAKKKVDEYIKKHVYKSNHYYNAYYIVAKETGKVIDGPFSRAEGDSVMKEAWDDESYQLMEGRWLTDAAFPGRAPQHYSKNPSKLASFATARSRRRDWKSMNYGDLPTKRQFMTHYKRELGENGLYQMHLKGNVDCEAAEDTIFNEAIEQEAHFDSDDTWDGIKQLKRKWQRGNEAAGDLASGILYTLEFEWI
jgi:hypothetical protein